MTQGPPSTTAILVGIIFACAMLSAQTTTPTFEVASVRQNTAASTNARISMPADRFEATAVTLRGLIALAFGEPGPPPHTRPSDQIAGGPAWLDTDLFDVIAKTGSDTPPGPAAVGAKLLMLQSLLEERFALKIRHENRPVSALALVVARGDKRLGPQLQRSNVDCRSVLMARGGAPAPPAAAGARPLCRANVTPDGTLVAGSLTMSDFANVLARTTNRVVIDRTDLAGAFDLDLRFNPDTVDGLAPPAFDRPSSTSDRPSLQTALQEQLGLKLESTRGAIDVVVIDRAQRPTPD